MNTPQAPQTPKRSNQEELARIYECAAAAAKSLQKKINKKKINKKKINKKGYDCDFAIFLMTKDQIMSTYEVSEMTATEVVKMVQAYLCSMSPTISEYIVDRFIPDVYSSNPITKLMDLALQMEKPKK